MNINFRVMFALAIIFCLVTTLPLYAFFLKRHHFSKIVAGILSLFGTLLLATGAFGFVTYTEIINIHPTAYFIMIGPIVIVSTAMLLLLAKLTRK